MIDRTPGWPGWFKGYRPGQEEAVETILELFRSGVPRVMLDGPTGAGKTIVARGVAFGLGVQTTHTAGSHDLINQIARDFPTAVVLRGRDHYPIPGTEATAADCTWTKDRPCLFEAKEPGRPGCGGKVHCAGYEPAKGKALNAPFRVLTHAYLGTESKHVGRFHHPYLIIDEAESLESVVLGLVSVTFSPKLRDRLHLSGPRHVTKLDSISDWLRDDVLPALARDLASVPDSAELRWIRYREAATRRIDQTAWVLEHLEEGWVLDDGGPQRDYRPWSLKPVWARRYGARWISAKATRLLAMSATLISGEQVAHDLGLDIVPASNGTLHPLSVATVSMDTSFPPENRPVYVAPVADMRAGKDGSRAEEVRRLAMAIRRIMGRAPGENVLVHTHSYRLNNALYQELKVDPRVITYRAGGRDIALAAFLERPASVLLAPSLERGLSLNDDLCRVQIICKVPFPNLGDKVVAARLYGSGAAGRRWYAAETVRTIVQSSGRAIRHADDWAETWILDSAFLDLWRRERALFPRWWTKAVRTDVNVRALTAEPQNKENPS